MLPPKLTIEEVLGSGPFTVSLGRLGALRTEHLLLLRERVVERTPEDFRLDAAALGQVQVLLETPLPSIARMARRKPAPGPCPLSPGLIADLVQASAPLLDTVKQRGEMEVWGRSRLHLGLSGLCGRLAPVLARIEEAYGDPGIRAAMAGVCFTTDEPAGMLRPSPPFPLQPLPAYFNVEPTIVAPIVGSPICANFFSAAVQPADAPTPHGLPTAQITAYWPDVLPARTLPGARVFEVFTETTQNIPKWLESQPFGYGLFATAFGTVLLTSGCLWGVPTLVGTGLHLGTWGLARMIAAGVRDPRDRFNPPQPADIFRALHRYYLVLARPHLMAPRR